MGFVTGLLLYAGLILIAWRIDELAKVIKAK
jgi:hypothetical protein